MTKDPRIERLLSAYDKLVQLESKCHGMFKFRVLNNRYSAYSLEFHGIEGLYMERGLIKKRTDHRAELHIPAEFPLKMPKAKWITPIFHPNIAKNGDVCIGTRWTPMKGIDKIIIELANMIQYASYNLDNPYDYSAKRWVGQNEPEIKNMIYMVKFPPEKGGDIEIVDEEELEIVG